MPNVRMDAEAEANLALLRERWGVKNSAATREAIRRAALDIEFDDIGYVTLQAAEAERARRERSAGLLRARGGANDAE